MDCQKLKHRIERCFYVLAKSDVIIICIDKIRQYLLDIQQHNIYAKVNIQSFLY